MQAILLKGMAKYKYMNILKKLIREDTIDLQAILNVVTKRGTRIMIEQYGVSSPEKKAFNEYMTNAHNMLGDIAILITAEHASSKVEDECPECDQEEGACECQD